MRRALTTLLAVIVSVAGGACEPEKHTRAEADRRSLPGAGGQTRPHVDPNDPLGVHSRMSTAGPPEPAHVPPFEMDAPDAVLLVTGGTNGLLEVCNCRGPMPGGLARRNTLIRSYRAAFDHSLLIDIGDAFWVQPEDLRNDYLMRGYRQLGYDAIVPGDQELAAGDAFLRRVLAGEPNAGPHLLATTVAPASGGLPVRRELFLDTPGGQLAVLSYVPRTLLTLLPDGRADDLRVESLETLAARAKRLHEAGATVVLVVHGGSPHVADVARTIMPALILRGHTKRSREHMYRVAGVPVVRVGGPEHVGVVAMKLSSGEPAGIEFRLERVDRRWGIDHRLIHLYQAYARRAMREALDAQRQEGLRYVSSARCGTCHEKQYELWEQSQHAGAYDTLVENNRTADPSCLACHTTGFGTTHGFYTPRKTPELAGVNCQDCHRFDLGEHPTTGYAEPPVTENICQTCHTPVTDPNFDFATKRKLIGCGRAAEPYVRPMPALRPLPTSRP